MCVVVITTLLNKLFKFQSDWSYNNSQAYLFILVVDDLETTIYKQKWFKSQTSIVVK